MNRSEAKDLLPIIQAFVEGRKIEYRELGEEHWSGTSTPTFDIESNEYRIKPSPKYRPFANAEECWQEMQKHQPFGWIKGSGEYKNISGIRATGSYPILINVEHCGEQYENSCNMSEMFKNYTFADGTPFGIKEE